MPRLRCFCAALLLATIFVLAVAGCEGLGLPGAPADRTESRAPKEKDVEAPPKTPVEKSDYIGENGGRLAFGNCELIVPRGALRSKQYVTVKFPQEQHGQAIKETHHQLFPTGFIFEKPALIKIKYDPGNLSGFEAEDLVVGILVEGVWREIGGSIVDADNLTVSAPLDYLSEVALVVKSTSRAKVNAPPDASFTFATIALEDGRQRVEYDAAASSDTDGKIVRYDWDFDGDGVFDYSSPTSPAASYLFPKVGVYTTILKVTDNGLKPNVAFATQPIEIDMLFPPKTPDKLGINVSVNPPGGKVPITLNFAASAVGGMSPYRVLWDFGEGKTAEIMNPSYKFEKEGKYKVNVYLADESGQELARQLTVNLQSYGLEPKYQLPLKVSLVPSAESGDAPFAVDYTIKVKNGREPFKWKLEFGDEPADAPIEPGSGAKVTHTYERPGLYLARIIVTDADMATGTAFVLVTARAAEGGASLEGRETARDYFSARFGRFGLVPSQSKENPLVFSFMVKGTGSDALVSWDFGDGFKSSEPSPKHEFAKEGVFEVKAEIVESGERRSETLYLPVGSVPTVAIQGDRTVKGLAPLAFAPVCIANGLNQPAEYTWDFGDGATSSEASPSHIFPAEGTYNVTVTAVSGETRAVSEPIQVVVLPRAEELRNPVLCSIRGENESVAEIWMLDASGEQGYRLPISIHAPTGAGLYLSPDGAYAGYLTEGGVAVIETWTGLESFSFVPAEGKAVGVAVPRFGNPVFVSVEKETSKSVYVYSSKSGLVDLTPEECSADLLAITDVGDSILLACRKGQEKTASLIRLDFDAESGRWGKPSELASDVQDAAISGDGNVILFVTSKRALMELAGDSGVEQVSGSAAVKSSLTLSKDGHFAAWIEGVSGSQNRIMVAKRTDEGHLEMADFTEATGISAERVALLPSGNSLVVYSTLKTGDDAVESTGLFLIDATVPNPLPVFIAKAGPEFSIASAR